jgi:hypothetical protein
MRVRSHRYRSFGVWIDAGSADYAGFLRKKGRRRSKVNGRSTTFSISCSV